MLKYLYSKMNKKFHARKQGIKKLNPNNQELFKIILGVDKKKLRNSITVIRGNNNNNKNTVNIFCIRN